MVQQTEVEFAVAVATAVAVAVALSSLLLFKRGTRSSLGSKAGIVFWRDAWHISMST